MFDDVQAPERRYVQQGLASVRIEQRAEGDPTIEGYAAVFYDGTPKTEFVLWEGAVERIMSGAFDRAIGEDDVRMLFNHDPNVILGRSTAGTLALNADGVGLRYVNTPPDTTAAQDLVASIRRGDITGSSFSFIATDIEWRKEDNIEIREIRGARLFDVGPVVFPAYDETTTGLRAASDWPGASTAFLVSVRAERDTWRAGIDVREIARKQRQARFAEIRLTSM